MWKKRILSLLINTILILSAISIVAIDRVECSNGAILYVGGSVPGNYTSIQSAIDNATGMDTIFVYHGTYYENLKIENPILLIGENRETTVIDGGQNAPVININAENITISNFTIRQSGGPYEENAGIFIGLDNNKVHNNIITDNFYGIYIAQYGDNNKLFNNNIINNSRDGVYLDEYSHTNEIYDNNISMNDKNGIYLVSSCSSNTIRLNKISLNGGSAIKFGANKIFDPTFWMWYYEGISLIQIIIGLASFDLNISNWDWYLEEESMNWKDFLWGLSLNEIIPLDYYTYANNITSNIISSNGRHGIEIDGSKDNDINNNIITSNRENGVQIRASSSNNLISGNQIYNNQRGLKIQDARNNYIVHNNIYNNTDTCDSLCTSEMSNYWHKSYPIGGNYWGDYTGYDIDVDGIGDLPYTINNTEQDLYPLMNPWTGKGDMDSDYDVDIFDFDKFAQAWGTISGNLGYHVMCDFDDNGKVDVFDFDGFAQVWGKR